MKLSDTTAKVIDLGSAIREYWNRELPMRHPNYPIIGFDEDSGPPPPEERELGRLLSDLTEDDIYKLIFIMHLGRGDIGTSDLEGGYKTLRNTFGRKELAISHMRGKAPLADYLSDGMSELQAAGINIDHLTFESSPTGK